MMHLFQHTGEGRFSLHALMNFVNYTVYNTSAAEFTNVNAGGDDIAAGAVNEAVALSDAELAAVCVLDGAVVMQTNATAAEKSAALSAMLGLIGAAAVIESAAENLALLKSARDRSNRPLLHPSALVDAYGSGA